MILCRNLRIQITSVKDTEESCLIPLFGYLVKRPVEVASPEGITVNMSLVLE